MHRVEEVREEEADHTEVDVAEDVAEDVAVFAELDAELRALQDGVFAQKQQQQKQQKQQPQEERASATQIDQMLDDSWPCT